MIITCTQENLNQGLSIVSNIASKSTSLPILNNVLLKAEGNAIELMATNLEIGINCRVRGKVESDGDITVQSRLLSDYVNLLAKENITIKVEDGDDNLSISTVKNITKIKGTPAVDFPLIPQIEKEDPIVCRSEDLRKALSQVIFAVSVNETRPEINGIFFSVQERGLILAGTDSYRLAEKKIPVRSGKKNIEAIVPARTFQELLRILSNFKDPAQLDNIEDIEIYVSENQILFKFGNVEMVSRLIEGRYPNYKEIIPNNFKSEIRVGKDELVKAVKTASLFSKTGIYDVVLTLSKEKKTLTVTSENNQVGQNTTTLSVDMSGEDNSLAVNFRFLLDGLSNIGSGDVSLKVVSNTSPCVLEIGKDTSYQYIVMPIN